MIDEEIVVILNEAVLDELVAEGGEEFVYFFLAREIGDEEAGGLGGGDDLVFVGGGGLAEQGRLDVLDDLLVGEADQFGGELGAVFELAAAGEVAHGAVEIFDGDLRGEV